MMNENPSEVFEAAGGEAAFVEYSTKCKERASVITKLLREKFSAPEIVTIASWIICQHIDKQTDEGKEGSVLAGLEELVTLCYYQYLTKDSLEG
jgi:hypothetical protein